MADQQIPREGSDTSLPTSVSSNNGANIASPRSSTESRSSNRNSLRVGHMPPANHQHRQSLTLSITPPPPKNVDPAFVDRDWREISIGELISPDELRFVEMDTGIEEATNLLIDSGAAVLLIRESPQDKSAVATFDYSDLNAYLLLAAGLAFPPEAHRASYDEIARKAQEGEKIPLRDVKGLGVEKEPLITLPASANVLTAVETFGGGVHRVVVTKESQDNEVVGIFSQFRLVKFLWENGRSFPVIEELYPQSLRDLRIGSQNVISINGDKPLSEALQVMNSEGVSSLVVVDNHFNVIGNISTTDVKLLTRSSSLPLLHNTCTHFISVILSTRGLIEGKDSFPVFHVNPGSTLAHTVAKIAATRSHRLWVTDPASPSSSGPPTPSHSAVHIPLATPPLGALPTATSAISPPPSPLPQSAGYAPSPPSYTTPHHPTPPQPPYPHSPTPGINTTLAPSIPASALPGARLSGKLVGVVSLTDILNLHARASGLSPADPAESRRRRRSSSTSSMNVPRSGEIGRELFSRGV
ncbi:uncharacterized protein N7483_002047 [Penicillium malachiteum]|uniref:uncharacterized protein n=1 Tax=Penicillium malachiteum TaxID=1324776 RepID=UPI002547FB97|nr:uncharacterized protein N7483_002047 [Penicillium malachiteum]KAJ5736922.1 hypothetical protein N7483_002047 [Penicillium malachiteum]